MALRADDVTVTQWTEGVLLALEASPRSDLRTVARRVRSLRAALLADALHGEVVPKASIPKALRAKHLIENLYVEDLPSFWRLLYTVTNQAGRRYVTIVEIVDHRTYDRWFPNRGR